MAIDTVIVHHISLPPGHFRGDAIERLFTNRLDWDAHSYYQRIRGLRVSAHFLLRRDGRALQFVSCEQRAWHAGQSRFRGRGTCNDFSIGIELEGTDETPYAEVQYRCLAGIVAALRRAYPGIAPDAIAGHADIAPGRKTDPGPAFEWPKLAGLLDDSRLA